jgi:hyperosmotically inducible protein
MSQSNLLPVVTAVLFGWLSSNAQLAYAVTQNNTTPSIKQKAVQYIDDSAITLSVKNKLLQDKKTQHCDISVKTTQGDVLLTGVVDTAEQLKYVCQQVAKVTGVRTVKSQIAVKSRQPGSKTEEQHQTLSEYSSDAVITTKVKAQLIADKRLSVQDITVETTQGFVTLTGVMENQQQIAIAEKCARSVKEVKGVKNQLRLKKQVTSPSN